MLPFLVNTPALGVTVNAVVVIPGLVFAQVNAELLAVITPVVTTVALTASVVAIAVAGAAGVPLAPVSTTLKV